MPGEGAKATWSHTSMQAFTKSPSRHAGSCCVIARLLASPLNTAPAIDALAGYKQERNHGHTRVLHAFTASPSRHAGSCCAIAHSLPPLAGHGPDPAARCQSTNQTTHGRTRMLQAFMLSPSRHARSCPGNFSPRRFGDLSDLPEDRSSSLKINCGCPFLL